MARSAGVDLECLELLRFDLGGLNCHYFLLLIQIRNWFLFFFEINLSEGEKTHMLGSGGGAKPRAAAIAGRVILAEALIPVSAKKTERLCP